MKIPSYVRIHQVLGDGKWHDFSDICNPQVGGKEGDRRLRNMRQKGWVDFEWRYKPDTHTPQYRLTKIHEAFWAYYKRYSPYRPGEGGQLSFC